MKPLMPMIEPKPFEALVAIDIETSSEGALLDIGCYCPASNIKYITFRNWKDFFEWLLSITGNVRIIAHNGFGFDYITFNQWLLKNIKRYKITDDDITYLSSESLLMGVIIRKDNSCYTFVDTMRYFPNQSLQKLAESFLGESKDDVPEGYISKMEVYRQKFKTKYFQYLRRDCELLYNVYCKFREEINEFAEIGELGLSAGSTSLRTFRKWLHTNYPRTRIFSVPEEFQNLADYSLRGGLTLYIGDGKQDNHLYNAVHHYDVISMYPSIMRFVPAPSSPLVYTKKLVKDFNCYRPGFYLCRFQQQKGRIPILFPLDAEYPQWTGEAILSHFDLQFLDIYGKYEISDGVCYEDYIFPFEGFMDDLLEKRLSAKAEKLTAKSHALKILMNSLYGKFGQKATREIISITSDRDWYDSFLEAQIRAGYNGSNVREYAVTKDYVIYGVEQQSSAFSCRFIGAMVTALARLKLGLILNTVHSIYCDTDSIFTQDLLDKRFTGNEPGDFEEDERSPDSMLCLGKKSYKYGSDIKFKGIPSKNMNFEIAQKVRDGEEVPIEYFSPTAWKTALKNDTKNPNKFLPRVRTVRRGKSLAEMGLLHPSAKLFKANEVKEFLDSLLSL